MPAKLGCPIVLPGVAYGKSGQLKGYQVDTGTIIITEPTPAPVAPAPTGTPKVAIYARVSATDAKRKGNLETQAHRLMDYCAAKGYPVAAVVEEIGSGVNPYGTAACPPACTCALPPGSWRTGARVANWRAASDQRPQLLKLLTDPPITLMVVEHQDRLTRFGCHYIESLLARQGRQIEVINQADDGKEDLIQDFVSIARRPSFM